MEGLFGTTRRYSFWCSGLLQLLYLGRTKHMAKKKETLYQPQKIKTLVEGVARMVARDPSIATDSARLHAAITLGVPGYNGKEDCFNCGANMVVYEYIADIVDGVLLLAMAKDVRHRSNALGFTEANKVHVMGLNLSHTAKCRITQLSYLGLVAKHRERSFWVITTWGWKVLRGEAVPRSTRYFRGQLIDRSVEMTTLGAMFQTHKDLIVKTIAKRGAVSKSRGDYRVEIGDYNSFEWVGFGGYADDVVPAAKVEEPAHDPWWNK